MPLRIQTVTISTANTPVALSSGAPVYATWVLFQALKTGGGANTGTIFVGDQTLAPPTVTGYALASGQTLLLPWAGDVNPYVLNSIYVAGTTAGDQVQVIYFVK